MIASAALKNDPEVAAKHNVAIMLSVSPEHAGSKYEHRSFFIDRVALLQRDVSDADAYETPWQKGGYKDPATVVENLKKRGKSWFNIFVGFCKLPNGQDSRTQMWSVPCSQVELQVMPPGFELNRYIPHVNRGITHFHASFWPLPRTISDHDLKSAEAPSALAMYTFHQFQALSGLKGGRHVIGAVNPDGSRTPRYKFCKANGHFRACAPGETYYDGPVEYKRDLENPSRMVRLLSKYLDDYEQKYRAMCDEGPDGAHAKETIVQIPASGSLDQAIEDMKSEMCPGR
ncbi:hypothetical protein FB45DRAFT_873872 [Roridomyces roridus]|uniref:Uncharacterized protein n=1 Tax=Roridomyces roridus TaxID=1738132 RepID=A0AAD7B9K2_9AGAR|nr:hypothetical protein FB45DRAFT_873872 [Roridomyces roridus]